MVFLSRCGSTTAVRVRDGINVEIKEEKKNQNDGSSCSYACTSLTVWRKSLLLSCHGFTVFDSTGNLIFRVDNYRGDRTDDIVLMDASGKSLVSLHRKKQSFVDNWLVFEGEAEKSGGKGKKPIYWVRKHVNLLLQSNPNVLANVFRGSDTPEKGSAFVIQGSYERRSCQVIDGLSRQIVAEIKRKDASIQGISFGLDVFLLIVRPGFESAFAMSLVLIVDQMFT
ncbi:hypothetical protein NE237_028697 [Protea cynaroides]|uniref:Uncharacterized protein n=1 Tax=Protea cynaroides TaxID=273540 RepID=A0A9Q0GSW5_9MAGN|nr:hypothetical protein NE237_028697 [Protea cynaroides]